MENIWNLEKAGPPFVRVTLRNSFSETCNLFENMFRVTFGGSCLLKENDVQFCIVEAVEGQKNDSSWGGRNHHYTKLDTCH